MEEKKTPQLKQTFLGRTGLSVSEVCLGTMTFNGGWGIPSCTEEEAFEIMNTFEKHGGNFIDTADVYGHSEEVIGKWLATKKRSDFVIATKVRGTVGKGPNDSGLSRKHIIEGVEKSLKRLQTSYIDLYQCHFVDNATPMEETLGALNDLVRAGKIHYFGVSNFTGWQLQKAVEITKRMGCNRIISLQSQHSLLSRWIERENVPVCKHEGLALLPWSPLKGGWLAGKYQRPKEDAKKPEVEGRVAWAQKFGWKETDYDKFANEHTWQTIDAINEVVAETKKSASQVSLRWLIESGKFGGYCSVPIIGVRTMAHLVDNLGVIGWELSSEQMEKLNKASAVDIPYPWSMLGQNDRQNQF